MNRVRFGGRMNRATRNSSERPRTTWTPTMNRFFIDLVLDHVRQGNMIDYAFRKRVWTQMNTLFNQKFGYRYGKDVLKNRYKSLRRKYNIITSILSHEGFCWDGARQMIVAEDKVWEDYIKVHPDQRSYRTKVLSYYSDLCTIYGSMPADGTYNDKQQSLGLKDDSSRTNSADTSGDVHSLYMSTAVEGTCDDAGREIEEDDGLFPVEVIFAMDATPRMLPTSKNPSRVSWTCSMDRYFIHLMLEQVMKGNKIGSSFHEEAWTHMTSLFSEKYGSQYDKDVLIIRFKTFRSEYISIKALLDHDGFHWNEKLQMVTADVHVWDTYIKGHPNTRQYRVRPLPHFHALCVIYETTSATGTDHFAVQAGNLQDGMHLTGNYEMFQDLWSPSTPVGHRDPLSVGQEESSHLGGETYISDHQDKRLLIDSSACEPFKKLGEGTEGMMEAINKMATAVTSLADMTKENNNSISTSVESLVDGLQALPDVDEDLLLDACDFLEDERKAKTFLALDARLRKKWLMRKLRPGL